MALVRLGDLLIGGRKAVAFGIHLATAAVVLISAGLLRLVSAKLVLAV